MLFFLGLNAECMVFFFYYFMSGFVDIVYCVFPLPQTLHPFIRCFNVQLIYRLRTCLSVLE